MYSTNVRRRLLLVVLMFATVLTAHAQQDQGRIAGVVKDANGAIVPGASLLVKTNAPVKRGRRLQLTLAPTSFPASDLRRTRSPHPGRTLPCARPACSCWSVRN
jgi:hypothetical protein